MGALQAASSPLKARFEAALVHLGMTVLVALLAAALVFGVWYPFPYREISGGRELFLLIVSIDLVVGPLLTFAVFDLRKGWPVMRRDLGVIAALQLAALAYGLHSVWLARPVYLVHEVDRFRVVTAADIDPADLDKAAEGWRSLPHWGPQLIGTRLPKPTDNTLQSVEMAMAGKDVSLRPDWWQAFGQSQAQVLAKAKPVAYLRAKYPGRVDEIDQAVTSTGRTERDLRVVPVVARKDWVAFVDATTGRPVTFAPFDAF